MTCTERVIVLVDMDCFYCQVEEKLDPKLAGKPIAVVQYNTWRGGEIIAVNYPAREKGVTRHMRGDEAKQKCPEIILAKVPDARGKADLTKYREAGKRVAEVLQKFTPILERASVDEAYLDITEAVKRRISLDFGQVHLNNLQNTYIVGYDVQDFLYNVTRNRDYSESNYRLAMGSLIAEEIRAEVYAKTGYKCSAGIAHNKILAKLVCGLHKPNKQTVLPQESVPELYKDLLLKKVPGLGGKFGSTLTDQLKISKMGELVKFSEKDLFKLFEEKTAKWLYNIARGIDYEPVTSRLISKSIGCCKKFPGRSALVTPESVEHWVNELTCEISDRLKEDAKENNRRAKQITLHFSQTVNDKDINNSRTLPLNSYDQAKIACIGLHAIKKYCQKSDGTYNIKYLGFSAGTFELNKKNGNISKLFKNMIGCKLLKNETSTKTADLQEPDSLDQNILQEINKLPSSFVEVTNIIDRKSLNYNKMTTSEEENIFSNEDEIDNKMYFGDTDSIYSAATDELNEDTKSLIYYEDIYPESVAIQPIWPHNFVNSLSVCNSPNISITNEMIPDSLCHSNDLLSIRGSSNSFFSRYFENNSTDDSCHSSPIETNFDTFKIIETGLGHSGENIKPHELVVINSNTKGDSHVELEKQEKEEVLISTENCPECKKPISQSDFQSHMDYHYALNIVKHETDLYKPMQSSISKSIKAESINLKHGTKRKIVNMKPIHTYLQMDELHTESSELCLECNKRIKLDDKANHMDYHLAKKLHLEINSQSSVISNKNSSDKICTKLKNKKKNDVKNMGNIFSFLKQ